MNHTPWIYTQRKHTPQAKFLLTKHCVAWRDTIITNYKAEVFPVVMYGCENWTVKKAERRRIDAFELWDLQQSVMSANGYSS